MKELLRLKKCEVVGNLMYRHLFTKINDGFEANSHNKEV